MLRMHDTSLMLKITEGRTPEGSIGSSGRDVREGSIGGSIGGFSGGNSPRRIGTVGTITTDSVQGIPDRLSSVHSSMSESSDS